MHGNPSYGVAATCDSLPPDIGDDDAPPVGLPTAIPQLLTVAQVAARIQRDVWSVYQDVKRGELRAVHFGRSVRVDAADLIDYIERRKTSAAAVTPALPPEAGSDVEASRVGRHASPPVRSRQPAVRRDGQAHGGA